VRHPAVSFVGGGYSSSYEKKLEVTWKLERSVEMVSCNRRRVDNRRRNSVGKPAGFAGHGRKGRGLIGRRNLPVATAEAVVGMRVAGGVMDHLIPMAVVHGLY